MHRHIRNTGPNWFFRNISSRSTGAWRSLADAQSTTFKLNKMQVSQKVTDWFDRCGTAQRTIDRVVFIKLVMRWSVYRPDSVSLHFRPIQWKHFHRFTQRPIRWPLIDRIFDHRPPNNKRTNRNMGRQSNQLTATLPIPFRKRPLNGTRSLGKKWLNCRR